MKKSSIIWLVVVIIVIVLVGYFWWSSMSSPSFPVSATGTTQTSASAGAAPSTVPAMNSTTGSTATPPQPTSAATLTLNNSGGAFGAYLSAGNGMTLYQYTKDADNVSNCTGACATAWPPYTVSTAAALSLTADPGITGKIATIKRADGSLQVTYRGLPLYFFAQDAKPGDVNGEAVGGFTQVAP